MGCFSKNNRIFAKNIFITYESCKAKEKSWSALPY